MFQDPKSMSTFEYDVSLGDSFCVFRGSLFRGRLGGHFRSASQSAPVCSLAAGAWILISSTHLIGTAEQMFLAR